MKPTEKLRVLLGSRSYTVQIGPGQIHHLAEAYCGKGPKIAVIISDKKLISARKTLKNALTQNHWKFIEIAVQAGESLKDLTQLLPIYEELTRIKASRDTVLFALGGGTIGDAAGFVASTYMRGIPWVSIPTTLLAQVDSGVGGKTAVNHPAVKNLIGTFYQPKLVICDTDFLQTLTRRELVSGLGEVVKYALAFDPKLFSFIVDNKSALLALDPQVLTHAICRSLHWKCKKVSADEFDQKGIREALNLGHTFAHALESLTSYKTFQHGEAVIWGLRFALALSQVKNRISPSARRKYDHFLSELPVPALPQKLKIGDLIKKMKQDKKARNGKVKFVLISRHGELTSAVSIEDSHIRKAFALMKEFL